MPEVQLNWWQRVFRTPQNESEAVSILYEISKTFIWLGILTALIGVFLGAGLVGDGLIYIGLAWALKTFRSRGAAVALAAVSCVGVITTLQNQFFGGTGARNGVLAVIVAAYSLQGCRVVFKYHSMINSRIQLSNILIKSALASLYSGIAFLGAAIAMIVIRTDYEHISNAVTQAIIILLVFVFGAAFSGLLPFTKNRPTTTSEPS